MSKISLRAYNREIEGLIEQNQFDQAIAHARHILKFYPKHIQTYRLLGKAYLESQRFVEATDLFQRVLSAVPDDFISHVGMSIIREDEGNLDEAIWHMERAFEVQPANSAIQKELRRLYGRRDGLEPPKVRLTRGALARMYLKGELYPQAIAELRAALAEDPQRADLLTLLTQAYFAAGMRVEAAETCSTLIKRLPYSLEANRILAEILANSERAAEADTYRHRVFALEPYYAYITPATPSLDKVPDTTITLEKLVWSPGQPLAELPAQPDWATTLGVNLGEAIPTQEEPQPQWLDETVITSASSADVGEKIAPFEMPRSEEVIPPQQPEEEPIPDWMKEAGWQPASEAGEKSPDTTLEGEVSGEDLVPGEIPEWLQAIAPKEPPLGEETAPPGQEETPPEIRPLPPWLEETPPGATDSVAVWLSEKQPTSPEESGADLESGEPIEIPDWLKELEPTEPTTPEEQPQASIPPFETLLEEETQWQAEPLIPPFESESQAETVEPAMETETQPLTGETGDEEALAWLEGLAEKQGIEETPLIGAEEEVEAPAEWVLEASAGNQEEELIPADTEKAEVPEWLKEAFEAELPPQTTELSPETETSEEIPDWLRTAMTGTTTPEEPIASAVAGVPPVDLLSEEPAEAIPEWLRQPEDQSEPEATVGGPITSLPTQTEIPSEAALPEASLAAEPTPEEFETTQVELTPWPIEQPQIMEEPEEEASLLSDTQPMRLHPPQEAPSQPPEVEAPPYTAESELPPWLEGLGEEAPPNEHIPSPETTLPETEATIPPQIDDEAAFAWLENLAARQGADEALLLKPEERLETPPEWVQKAIEEAESSETLQAQEQVSPLEEVSEVTSVTEAQPPISGLERPVTETISKEGEPSPELPEWLVDVEQAQLAEEEAPWSPVPQPEPELMPSSEEMPPAVVPPEEVEVKPLLNLNEAGLSELERLPGVGFIRAQAIITYRNEHGAFNQIDDLLNVSGFDAELVNSLKNYLTLGEPEVAETEAEVIDTDQITLIQARNALIQGDSALALSHYQTLIKEQRLLSEVIRDLNEALYRFPVDIFLWQALGDAYLRAGHLQDALDAYTKAEELLR